METDKQKERRKDIRVPLINEKCNWKLVDGIEGYESKLIDFSASGAFIHSTIPIPIKSEILIHFKLPGDMGFLPIYGKVLWQRWRVKKTSKLETGIGIKFIDLDDNHKKILDSFATYLRNRQIIAVSARIVEEFFGKLPPTIKR